MDAVLGPEPAAASPSLPLPSSCPAAAELAEPLTVQEKAVAAWTAARRTVTEGPKATRAQAQRLAHAGWAGVQGLADAGRAGVQHLGATGGERLQQAGKQARATGCEAATHLRGTAAAARARLQAAAVALRSRLPGQQGGSQ